MNNKIILFESNKIENSSIKAPTNGTINIITVKTKGEAISSGKILMEITPETEYVLAEAKISSLEIGFYMFEFLLDLSFMPLILVYMVEISYISSDTILDKNTKEEQYIIHIKSLQKHVGDNKNLIIRAGMT